MSAFHRTCIVKEFPIPEREYRVAPARCWDGEPYDGARRGPSRRGRRRRSPLTLLLLGLLLFGCGFLLGRTALARETPAQAAGVSILDPEDWNLLLVNWEHPLPEDFSLPELTQLVNGHAIDRRAYPDLQAMMDGARAAGLQPTICSSYRTWDKQEKLFDNKVQSLLAEGYGREEAERQAATWVARPGTSEHQAGLAVDIVDKSYQLLDRGQEETAVQKWLMDHCAEYGFILRYPTDKSALTGVNYEPWHYRYVGPEAAAEIMDRGICLEEYLAEVSG